MVALIKSHLFSENERYLNPAKIEEATRRSQADFFDSLAPHWEADRQLNDAKVQSLLDACRLRQGERLLDLACGDGILEDKLLSYGVKIDGVDISPEMISLAKKAHQNPNLTYFCRDFYEHSSEIPYDVILVFDAYPHFLDKDAFAQKAASLLKKGGRLYILHVVHRSRSGGIGEAFATADCRFLARNQEIRRRGRHAKQTEEEKSVIPDPLPLGFLVHFR